MAMYYRVTFTKGEFNFVVRDVYARSILEAEIFAGKKALEEAGIDLSTWTVAAVAT